MFRRLGFTSFLIFASIVVFAQNLTVSGTIRDVVSKAPIQGATVVLRNETDTTIRRSAISNASGSFTFNELQRDTFLLTISSIGYGTWNHHFRLDTLDLNLNVELSGSSDVLAGVTVTATVPPVVQRGDTVQYNASQFKVNPDATVEDLARKMPGITIQNGQVTAHGEAVQRVTIDGRELFGEDATAALRNLPAEIVDKIQVFDRLSEQAQLTGFDDGNTTKGINIITKANMRNGQFGRVFAGYGTDNRYQAGGNTTFLKENRRISLVGNFNNINQQNFAAQDLLGVTSSGNQRGGGGFRGGGGGGNRGGGGAPRGGGNFQGGNTGNFLVGQQNGINRTNAVGINYANNLGKKVTLSASYLFNNTNNLTDERVSRQYFLAGIPNFNQVSTANSRNNNHRFNARMEYKIDSFNTLLIIPSVSIQDNNSVRNITTAFFDPTRAQTTAKTDNTNNSSRFGSNLNNSILWRRSFRKRGRSLSVNLNTSYNNRTGEVYNNLFDTTFLPNGTFRDSIAMRFTDQMSNGYNLSTNIAYTEPIGQNSQLQFNYNPTYSISRANQQAYDYEDNTGKYSKFSPNLSSKFDNTFTAQNAGVSYRYGTRDNQVSFGANYQHSTLHSDQDFPRTLTVHKTFQNILPNAMARLKINNQSNIRLMYRANVNQPSVTQLQDVFDFTNLPFVTAGNPLLEQQYMHILSSRYTFTNTQKGLLFVGNVFLQRANNYITNATFVPLRDSVLTSDLVLKAGQQLTKPINLDGYMSIRSFFTFATPVKFIKSNFNVNGGVTYSKMPGIINNVFNESRNTTYNIGSVLASNVSEFVDFTVAYSANFSTVKNDLQPQLNTNYFSHNAGVQLNLLSKSGWFFQNDINNQLYSGLAQGFNQNYILWNMGVGKKFLKNQKGELRLNVFDLLKQNRSINRNVTETYIEDVNNQVLQQYFMLTFSYNLRNFGTAATRGGASQRQMQGGTERRATF